jgi:hypothetical protein
MWTTTAPTEPTHPTYGALDNLLAQLGETIRSGEEIRIGHHGAISWFTAQYGKLKQESEGQPVAPPAE